MHVKDRSTNEIASKYRMSLIKIILWHNVKVTVCPAVQMVLTGFMVVERNRINAKIVCVTSIREAFTLKGVKKFCKYFEQTPV
jgi:hypothetical protein